MQTVVRDNDTLVRKEGANVFSEYGFNPKCWRYPWHVYWIICVLYKRIVYIYIWTLFCRAYIVRNVICFCSTTFCWWPKRNPVVTLSLRTKSGYRRFGWTNRRRLSTKWPKPLSLRTRLSSSGGRPPTTWPYSG